MPAAYRCRDCALEVTIGSYSGSPLAEYGGGVFGVCAGCGAQFLAKIANTYRGPEYFECVDVVLTGVRQGAEVKVAHRLREDLGIAAAEALARVRGPPLLLLAHAPEDEARERQRRYAAEGAIVTFQNRKREPNPDFGPIVRDRLLRCTRRESTDGEGEWVEVPIDRTAGSAAFDWGEQRCSECATLGAFLLDSDTDPVCPGCKQTQLELISGWVS